MNRTRVLLILTTLTLAWVGARSLAQDAFLPSAVEAARKDLGKGHYLRAIDSSKSAAAPAEGKAGDPIAEQLWEQFSPFITNELPPADYDSAGADEMLGAGWPGKISRASPRDAIEEIVRRARATNIVILNEAHNSPHHRAFALEVARALRPLGYSVLAVEALRNYPVAGEPLSGADRLKRDGFARLSTGDYTRDPVFAGFLRGALSIGYEPVAYEETKEQMRPGEGIVDREKAQAQNLVADIFSTRPKTKTLIYVGLSHVAEKPVNGANRMAGILKRLTKVDPLTIDQATVTDLTPQARRAYDRAAAKIGNRSAILFDGNKPLVLGLYESAVDLQVIHPPRAYRRGRPTWLAALGGRPVPIPKGLRPTAGRRLVQVFSANAPSDAVPLDQVIVTAGKPVPALFAPAGPLRFETQQ